MEPNTNPSTGANPDRRRKADMPPPPPYIVEPTTRHRQTFILLHGLGSNGEKFGRELMETGSCSDKRGLSACFPGARFIFPTARWRRSTAFKRAMLTQWFDIANMSDRSDRNYKQLPGLRESFREILALIDHEENSGIPRRNIVLGGLSNGCAMSIICAIALDGAIGGFLGMSGWMPFQKEIECHMADLAASGKPEDVAIAGRAYVRKLLEWDGLSGNNANPASENPQTLQEQAPSMPVFLGHGTADEKMPIALGDDASRTMAQLGFDVEWQAYEGLGHWYKIPDEIDDVVHFLRGKVWAGDQ